MLRAFLKERRSWILFVLFIELLLLFTGYIDQSIPFESISYIVFLSMIMFVFFLIIRYQRETRFYQQVQDSEGDYDTNEIKRTSSPYESIVAKAIIQQKEKYETALNQATTAIGKEKDDLLAWIHEVKTPLTTLQLIIERVEDNDLQARLTYEWLRIHLLLDQQLHLRRIPFMENDLYIEKVSIASILVDEINALRSWCMQKGIGFDMDLHVQDVLTDSKWIRFILRQLLTNAVKYSKQADIRIYSFMEDGNINVAIQDFGRGIPARDLPRIFDRGFTGTDSDNAATGMGLYLAKQAAESLKIAINVQSTIQEGTTFIVTFPKENEFLTVTRM